MRDIKDLIANITGGASSAHAYIVEGRAGSARSGFIDELAMGLECTGAEAKNRPCGRCSACRQVAAGTSLDVIRMQMSGRTGYRTEDANAFAERLDMGAYGRFLIGIIDYADSLSEIVQNKLLKTLEEPRGNVILILGTSNRDHLLSTVRSRCSVIRLCDYVELPEDEASDDAELRAAAELLADGKTEFFRFREALDKCMKERPDALLLIDMAEDVLRERMLAGRRQEDPPAVCAAKLELAEKARADIGSGMDKNRALKRLFLEISQQK